MELDVHYAHWLHNITVNVWVYQLASSDFKRQNFLENIRVHVHVYMHTGRVEVQLHSFLT
jgi:hypothetical protein